MKPNSIGPKILFFNPGISSFTTAELAAIDTPQLPTSASIKPYAYSATIRDDYDTRRFTSDATGVTSTVALGQRVSFGIFLSSDLAKKNLLWQLSGRIKLYVPAAEDVGCGFFFGRKATNNTVTSSLAAPQNDLASHILLPERAGKVNAVGGVYNYYEKSIVDELFSYKDDSGFTYCFGAFLENLGTSPAACVFDISLAARKFNTELDNFDPNRP